MCLYKLDMKLISQSIPLLAILLDICACATFLAHSWMHLSTCNIFKVSGFSRYFIFTWFQCGEAPAAYFCNNVCCARMCGWMGGVIGRCMLWGPPNLLSSGCQWLFHQEGKMVGIRSW